MRSKLKQFIYKDPGTSICGHSNSNICTIFESGDQFKSTVTKKSTVLIFHLILAVVA